MEEMKKWLLTILALLSLVVIAACSNEKNEEEKTGADETKPSTEAPAKKEEEVTLKISASSTPHAEILEFIAPDLEQEGVKLDIVITSDGIQTNQQTYDGELDANFFQHTPYLNLVNGDAGLDLVNVKGIHIEPFGVYSKKIDDIKDLSDGAQIAVPKDPVNFSRALQLFAAEGIIELTKEKEGDFVLEDITKNEKNLEFVPVDGGVLVRSLDDVEASAINTNYALEAGYKPLEDALIIEGNDSPYVNILVSRPDNQNDEAIQKLAATLTTEKVREFILEKYEGAVVPAF